jgi:hypothetical protein
VGGGGEIVRWGTGTTVQGKVYHLSSTGDWVLAVNQNNGSGINMLAMALGTTPQDGMLLKGSIRATGVTGTQNGSPLYLGTTAGEVQAITPTTPGDIVRIVGYSLSTFPGDFMYFDPSSTWIVNA